MWRPKVHPPELSRSGRPGFDYAQAQRLGVKPRDEFPSHWRSADVRGVLKAMCGDACAYCLDVVGRPGEDVEHYRPKNLYWFLAYSPENYLSSCRRCNSSRKINRFPLEQGAARAGDAEGVVSEGRLLLDPVRDDIERAMRIELQTGAYNWVVEPGARSSLRRRAEHTIEFFRLNRDTELRRSRIEAIQRYLDEALSPDAATVKRSRQLTSRFVPHGAAVRSVAMQQNPALVPSLVEELQWHVTRLAVMLDMADAHPGGEEDLITSRTYALAAIRADPPRGAKRAEVAAWYGAMTIASGTLADRVAPIVTELRTSP
ncbi:MAG: hypothetical protein ABIW84_06200 [Ilumatobacteraceae bacterium]